MFAQQSVVMDEDSQVSATQSHREAGASRLSAVMLCQAGATLILLVLGWLEGWYKRTDFSTDAISYLDISRAIPLHDWKMIFNPLWSVGYPLLLAAARPFFPSDSSGEWLSIHVVNMILFVGAWSAFLFLLEALRPLLPRAQKGEEARLFLFLAGAGIFASVQLCIDSVSRVGPDLMVSALFFTATALVLRLVARPTWKRAVLLGIVLGVGYWTKGIFLALSTALLVVAGTALWARRKTILPLLPTCIVFAVLVAPYAAGLSWSYGQFTLGDSGPLNYAFHVNLLPRWTNWQGEPGGYGKPIHPTHQLSSNPDIFSFAEPYHNTYSPFGNISYWYQGYRHFVSARNQAIAIARDLNYLMHALLPQPIFYAIVLGAILILIAARARRQWLRAMLALWPLFVPALIGVLLYVQVHLEDRYLGSFLTILCLLPFAAFAKIAEHVPGKLMRALSLLLIAGAVCNFAVVNRDVFAHLRNHYTYRENPQWKLGLAMERAGLKPGDGIAVIGGPNASCTWAYIAHLRIIAEMGGKPFDQRHPEPPDAAGPIAEFWHASPDEQQQIVDIFRSTGARAVIASEKPVEISAPAGWQLLPGTETWIYRLQ
jgi:hypothetical protein